MKLENLKMIRGFDEHVLDVAVEQMSYCEICSCGMWADEKLRLQSVEAGSENVDRMRLVHSKCAGKEARRAAKRERRGY